MSQNTVFRVPRFRRKYPGVYSYRAELLYGKRFQKKLSHAGTFEKVHNVLNDVQQDYFNRQDKITVCFGTRAGRTTEVRVKKAGAI